MSPQIEILLIAVLVAITCALLGVFLILRRMAMMADAISHTILLGIVLAFFVTQDLSSPLLIIGAAFMGTITVFLVETVNKTNLISEDASIGLIFPLLFSLGIILVTLFAGDIHLDVDAVLLGELAFAPFNRLIVNGIDIGPKSLYIMAIVLLANTLYLLLFYKELKISSFDAGLAAVLGFSPIFIHYSLMTLVSITAVAAFDAVGAVLVVAFMVGPPTAAYLITDDLKKMIALSGLFGALSAISGYFIATFLDVTISGSMATMVGIVFTLVFIFTPSRGLISILRRRKNQKYEFAVISLLMHLINHEGSAIEKEEAGLYNIKDHMLWEKPFANQIINHSINKDLLYVSDEVLKVTEKGREFALSNYFNIINQN